MNRARKEQKERREKEMQRESRAEETE